MVLPGTYGHKIVMLVATVLDPILYRLLLNPLQVESALVLSPDPTLCEGKRSGDFSQVHQFCNRSDVGIHEI